MVEGPTTNLLINDLRKRQQKNLILSLLISKGVPMVLMGDEIGRSQGGTIILGAKIIYWAG